MVMEFHKETFVITNFSQKSSPVNFPPFSSGGCEWYVKVYPNGVGDDGYLSLYLLPNEPESLGLNWKRIARFYFALVNHSDKVLHITPGDLDDQLFCPESLSLGFPKTLPRKQLKFLKKDSLTIELFLKVKKAFDGYDVFPDKLSRNSLLDNSQKETVDVNGFQVLSSQVTSVREIFAEHPDIAVDFKSKNQVVRTEYMNVLLSLIEKTRKPPQSLSDTELSNAHIELNELTEVGFKLEWLKKKLEKVSLESKKAKNADGLRIQALEEHVKHLELTVSDLKVELEKEKANLKQMLFRR